MVGVSPIKLHPFNFSGYSAHKAWS